MFRIGEFSTIARVSGRLLRYYDGIGLLSPQHVDAATGYRYYTAGQLERLNRILALKDLGLSLDQVARMVDGNVSTGEIRGMLMLKKAELERTLSEEADRLARVESRLQQIDEQGSLGDYDIVVKAAAAQPFLSLRRTFAGMGDAVAMLKEVIRAVSSAVSGRAPVSSRWTAASSPTAAVPSSALGPAKPGTQRATGIVVAGSAGAPIASSSQSLVLRSLTA